ncbi:MAG TPA: SDR family oxidoreductase [Solirubrobacteraceae bacterium]|nr:SDR family oxidoreductase [Solirubrobacteraceae bacterium]
MSETVLLTGATGFLGMELLARLIERGDTDVVCLVRAPSADAAAERLATVFARLYEERPEAVERVTAVAGDVSADDLGLDSRDREALIAKVTSVVHCAASISFDLTLEEARQVNTGGAIRMLELSRAIAASGGLRRHLHVSTAYVAGRYRGLFRETDLDLGQGFRNTYEHSKFDGEQAIGAAAGELPLVIARPSIIVGDSRSGWTSAFNVIYWPMRAFSRGLMDEVAIDPDGLADIVPIDYVADGLMALLDAESVSGTVALVAGAAAPTNAELIELACRQFGREPPRIVADPASRLQETDLYVPYFGIGATLDDARARELLEPLGLAAPPLRDYFATLIDYAERARWGKRQITREAAAATA